MEVVQFRAGFATNSSSSHSIIYRPDGATDDDVPSCQEYGWQWFTLGSREEKAAYAAQAFKNLPEEWLEKYLGVTADPEGYIDHESVGMLGWVLTEEDLQQFVRLYIDNDQVVFYGGNDNDERPGFAEGPELPGFNSTNQWRDGDNFLVIFNAVNGDKTHLAKHPGVTIGSVPADFPELVDLKVSDYCSLGCSFCYQNSTRRGKHGDIKQIKAIIEQLGRLGTLEIAIGGGEPLQYPHIREVLEVARANNVVPNFTTKDYKTLIFVQDLIQQAGGVAISVATVADTREAMEEFNKLNYETQSKISFQIPVGAQPYEEFREMIALIAEGNQRRRVTLLGYKMVGRGTQSKYYSFEDRLKEVFKYEQPARWDVGRMVSLPHYPYLDVGIDTQLANIGGTILDLVPMHARDKVVMKAEGLHSCYIDAVEGTISPSSYCNAEFYQPLVIDQIGDVFHEFSSTACEALVSGSHASWHGRSIAVQNVDSDSDGV